MDILLILAKVAVVTDNKKLREQLKKIFNYVDKKGCKLVTEASDSHIYVYDATNSEYLLSINIESIGDINNAL